AVLSIMNWVAPGDAFMEWGWRVPFLLSIALVAVGYFVRMGVDESPVFEEMAERKEVEAENPAKLLFKRFTPLVIVAALVFAGNGTVGYMTTGGYIQSYASNPDGPVGLARGDVLNAVTLSAFTWMIFTLFAGFISDKIGRRTTYLIGFVLQAIAAAALFPLVNTANLGLLYFALIALTVGLGLTYGQQSAMYAELFPASIRASGVSITYALGSVLGGPFAPRVAAAPGEATRPTPAVSIVLVRPCVHRLICAFLLQARKGTPPSPGHEDEPGSYHLILRQDQSPSPQELIVIRCS